MTASPLPDHFTDNSDWLVQAIDPRARLARLVRMDRQAYRDASFLDDRLLQQQLESRLCNLDELVALACNIAGPPTGWIFHIGHVGSTLVSRLLGEMDGVLALREPRSLRDLAVADDGERPKLAYALDGLMSRRGQGDYVVIVKATSFVSEYAPLLTEPKARVLFLYASPRNYIAGILAGENSVKELTALESSRADRLRCRGIELSGFGRSDAFRAAAAWACEMTSLEAAADAMPDRHILWVDFDAMLDDVRGSLGRIAGHFELSPPAGQLDALANGPLMRRYSKALEYDYSPSLRAKLLDEATRNNLAEINEAVAALGEVAKSAPLLDRALRRAEGEI